MTDSISIVVPGWRATDANDEPISGAKLKFYAAGTTTPKIVYSDYDLTVSLGTVVTCDSAGYPTSDGSTRVIVYTGTAAYKVVCTTSADVTVWSHDNVRGASVTPEANASALPSTPVVTKTSNYTVLTTDRGKLINAICTSGSFAITLPSAVTAGDGFRIGIRHEGGQNQVTINSVAGQVIKRQFVSTTSLALISYGETMHFVSDGANWTVDSYVPILMPLNLPFLRIADQISTPPAIPVVGSRYIVGASPTGAWLTGGFLQHDVAESNGNDGWIRYIPEAGWLAWVTDEAQFYAYRSGTWQAQSGMADPSSSTLKHAVFEHQAANGTGGGTPTANAWTTRTLTTAVANTVAGASLASSEITLPVGNYLISCQQKFYNTATGSGVDSRYEAQQRLSAGTATISTTSLAGLGQSAGGVFAAAGLTLTTYDGHTASDNFLVSVTVAGTVRLQYYMSVAVTDGLGKASAEPSGGVEIHARVSVLDLLSLQGPTGVQGAPGPAGTDGADAGHPMQWSTATSGDPGSGKILGNNATIASITQLNINEINVWGTSIANSLATWDDSSSSVRGTIKVTKEGAAGAGANFHEFQITGAATDAGLYRTFPVAYVASAGTIVDSTDIAVAFTRTGDIGPTGLTGAVGSATGYDYETRAAAASATIPGGHQFLQTGGYATVGDGGHALYKKGASLTTGGFQSVDGAYWDLVFDVGGPNVRQFGALATGADDATAIANAWTSVTALSNQPALNFPAGVYTASSFPNFAVENARVIGHGEVRLRYTGTSHGVFIDGGTGLAGVSNMRFGPFIIEAPATALDGLRIRNVHRSVFDQIHVRGCGPTSAAIRALGLVCTTFINPMSSANVDGGFYLGATPKYGLLLDELGAGAQTSYCTIINPLFEYQEFGVYLASSLGNVLIGGTAEGCTSTGLFVDTTALDNKWISGDFEVNAVRDVWLDGRRNAIIDCDSQTDVIVGGTAQSCVVRGGRVNGINILAGASATRIETLAFNGFGAGGTIVDAGTDSQIRDCYNFVAGTWLGRTLSTGAGALPIADGGTAATTVAGARSAFGVGSADAPEFAGLNVGHASDTTLTRVAAGRIAVEGAELAKLSALAATTTGNGAALVGVEDAGSYFAGTTVEAVLAYLGAAVAALDQVVVLKGSWDASAGTFPGAGAAQAGWSYVVSVSGTVNSVAFVAGDRIVALLDNASTSTYASNWLKLDYTDAVSTVAGRTGAVVLAQADVSGLTTADSPQFALLNIGHATDTTLARSGAGDIAVEGNVIYRAGGTDVAIADGGSGASTVAGARANYGLYPGTPGGRLTLSSGTPVQTASVSGGTTVYYEPFTNRFVPIYDGTNILMADIGAALSQATTDATKSPAACTTNSNYDLFVWNDSGTYRCTRGPAWTSDTARGAGAGTTELTRHEGMLVNANAITNGPAANRGTFVGTIRTNASSTVDFIFGGSSAGGTAGVFGVWNMYNRVRMVSIVQDSTASWTYATASARALNDSNANRHSILMGLEIDQVEVELSIYAERTNPLAVAATTGIGIDSTTVYGTGAVACANYNDVPQVNQTRYLGRYLGWKFFQSLESPNAAFAMTCYGSGSGANFQNTLSASWMA